TESTASCSWSGMERRAWIAATQLTRSARSSEFRLPWRAMSARVPFASTVSSPGSRAAWTLAVALLLGCEGSTVAPGGSGEVEASSETTIGPSPVEPDQPGGPLVSVRPGVNDSYMEPDALGKYISIFEGERREVIAERDRK